MKFSILALGFAACALAAPTADEALVKRGLTTIERVITSVEDKTVALTSAINSYTGGKPSAIQSASDALISTITAGVTTVKATSPMNESEALNLANYVVALTKDVNASISALEAKKADFAKGCAIPLVQKSLQTQYSASQALSSAITSKVPTGLQKLAASLSAGITKDIDQGIAFYKGATNDASCSVSSSVSSHSSSATSVSSKSSSMSHPVSTSTSTSSVRVTVTACKAPSSSSSVMTTSSSTHVVHSTGTMTSTSVLPTFTGGAAMNKFSYSVGGAVVVGAALAAAAL